MESKKNNSSPKEPHKQIDFMGIFKRAALIVWRNRFLFWFGLLMALGSPAGLNFSSSNNDFSGNSAAKNLFLEHWQLAATAALAFLSLVIFIFLISLIAKAGLIKSVHAITLEKDSSFKKGWKEGKKYFLKLFKLFLLFFVAVIIIVLVLATPVIYFLLNHLWFWTFLFGLLAIAIFIPIIFVLAFTNIFAEYYIVLTELKVWSAIEAGYNLLLKNLGNSLVFALLFLVVDIILGLAMLPVIGIAFLILFPAGVLFWTINKIAFGIYAALAILAALVVLLFFGAVFAAFKTSSWTLFFKELAEVKKEEAEKITEEEKNQDIAAAPASPTAPLKGESFGGPEKA